MSTLDGFFPKYEYVYDEAYDCYLCPANEILSYSTANQDGYRVLAKELHGFRYTQEIGKAHMEVKAALTYACLNLKKIAKKRWKSRPYFPAFSVNS